MPLEAKSRPVEIEGGVVACRTCGEGPLVVLSHGLGPLAWGELERLGPTCTAVAVDWEASTLERKTRVTYGWFEPLVRALGHEQGTLCTWSMSAPGAIYFAAEEPAALSRMILIDPAGLAPTLFSFGFRDLWHMALMRLLGRPTRGFVRNLWRGWVWKEGIDTRELEAATLRFFQSNPDAFGMPGDDDEDEDEEEESLADELRYLTMPTLLLTGRHSQVLGPEHARAAAERLPNGELVVFERSGHALQLEEPERFAEVVARFVAGR